MSVGKSLALLAVLSTAGTVAIVAQSRVSERPRGVAWSSWKQTLLQRQDGMSGATVFDKDERLEFRWSAAVNEGSLSCQIEVRPIGDADRTYTIPELAIMYSPTNFNYLAPGVPLTVQRPAAPLYFATNVAIGSDGAHATFTVKDCGRIAAVAAGNLTPATAIPAF